MAWIKASLHTAGLCAHIASQGAISDTCLPYSNLIRIIAINFQHDEATTNGMKAMEKIIAQIVTATELRHGVIFQSVTVKNPIVASGFRDQLTAEYDNQLKLVVARHKL
jgi:hypothetical protein